MRRIILIFFIALSHTSFSQDKSIIFSSEINLETNAINGAIINEVFTSGYMNNNLKNRIISLNEQSHVINLNLNTSFIYREKINNELSYNFSFSDVNHVNTKFDNNILKLFLKGNAEYENEKLDFEQSVKMALSNDYDHETQDRRRTIVLGRTGGAFPSSLPSNNNPPKIIVKITAITGVLTSRKLERLFLGSILSI